MPPGLLNNDFDTPHYPSLGSHPDAPKPNEWRPIKIPRVDSLKDLNVEFELLNRYYEAQEMLLNNAGQPLNQRVQNLNAITGILKTITELQGMVYDMERLKKYESTLIEVLKQFPVIQDAFLAAYKHALGNAFNWHEYEDHPAVLAALPMPTIDETIPGSASPVQDVEAK